MFLPNPGILAAGLGGKTYAEFQARIATLATSGSASWAGVNIAAGAWTTAAAAVVGIMYDTPWNSSYEAASSRLARIVQHALPSQAAFDDQVANGYQMFVRIQDAADKINFVSVNRNGYASLSFNDGSPYPARTCTELIRWDGSQAWQSNPSIGGSETLYTW